MNTTTNGSSCSAQLNPTAQKIGETFAYGLIFVVSLVGNSFIVVIVYKTQTMRKPINYFITNMAMSDLLFPIFLFPRNLTDLYVDYQWLNSGPLGQALCKLVHFLASVSSFVSIQSLILIAVDRFGAVVFPLRSPLISSKLCPFFILATWIVALALSSPHVFAHKIVEYTDGVVSCDMQWSEAFGESSSEVNYFFSGHVVFFYIPTALLLILYSIIVIKLKTQKIPGEQSNNAEEQHAKRNRNVLKMAIVIVVGFLLCWIPLSIAHLLLVFERDRWYNCDIRLFYEIAFFIAISNSAINPCICFIFSGNYRQGLKRLLKCFNAAQQ